MVLLGLRHLAQAQFEIVAASLPRGKAYELLKTLPNCTVVTMEMGSKEMVLQSRRAKLIRLLDTLLAILKISILVKQNKIDFIYTFDRTIAMGISYAVSIITGCPLIFSAHTWYYLNSSRLHRSVLKHSLRVTVTSKKMQDCFLPYVTEPKKLVLIPNAIQLEKYDLNLLNSANQIRLELGLPVDASVIVLAGRLSPYKGQEEFIKAASIVLKKYSDAYFLMFGAEDVPGFKLFLNKTISDLGVGDRVSINDFRPDIPRVFACADIVTMPSIEEPFGLVALEGMALKKPIIATRAGGVPDFLTDGEAGYLIEQQDFHALADAIIKMLDQPAKAQEMGKKGREIVEHAYNDKIYGKAICDFFDKALT